jgi:sugar phosphate isomerase/epimerase
MNYSRRELIRAGVGTAALWAAGVVGRTAGAQEQRGAAPRPDTRPAAAGEKRYRVGLQLYSVRGDCAKDLPGVLRAVGKMGYEGVEFAGYYDRAAAELRKMLDDNGLKCCGTHTGLDTLASEKLAETVEFNRVLGNRFLMVPSLPAERTASVAALQETARIFTELAAKVKDRGMLVGYHAHAGDFKKLEGGETPWDILFTHAGPEVLMQLDTSNCLAGGGDPVAVLKKYPGRSLTIHVKEHGKEGATIGEGEVNWAAVLRECRTTGGTEWFVVEQESYRGAPLDSVKESLAGLRKLLG